MGYDEERNLLLQKVQIQSQSMHIQFIVEAFKSVLEFSLLLGCIYGVLMLLVEFQELIGK